MFIDYNFRICGEKSSKRNKLNLQKQLKLSEIIEIFWSYYKMGNYKP